MSNKFEYIGIKLDENKDYIYYKCGNGEVKFEYKFIVKLEKYFCGKNNGTEQGSLLTDLVMYRISKKFFKEFEEKT